MTVQEAHLAIKDALQKAMIKTLADLGYKSKATDVPLEFPADLKNGDYSTNLALIWSKTLKLPPRELAEKIVANAGPVPGVEKIEIAGAGFINFYLAKETFASSIEEARTTDMWGSGTANSGKKIMVEYTDPNPFKEFHIGHLVPNVIGESISRLYQFTAAELKRANYQGDVGRHVARAIWGLQANGDSPDDVKALGKAYATGAAADLDGTPAKDEITAINKKVYERSDASINDLYDRGRKTSLEQFEKLYSTLGTKFDYYFFESNTGPFGKKIVEERIPDVFEKSAGAVVFPESKSGLHTRVFLNSEGLPTYEAKELGLSKMKYEKFPYDISVIVTGNEINEYFKVLLSAMKFVFPELATKTKHVSHGMMRLTEGKMSSRTGNIISGESLLEDLADVAKGRAAESRAEDKEKLAQDVAVAAIKFQILKGAASKDIIFDREKALSVEGDSGPYLQYAHARTRAIMEKATAARVSAAADINVEGNTVSRLLPRFPETVARATEHLEPHIVTTYLVELASAFNAWYAQEQILDGTTHAQHKLALVEAVSRTLKNGLWILGIPAPEKM